MPPSGDRGDHGPGGDGVYAISRRSPPARRGVLAQGCHRSNTVFIGLPLVLNAFGQSALGPASILIAFMVVVENLLAVLVLTLPHQRLSARDPSLWRTRPEHREESDDPRVCRWDMYSPLGIGLPVSLDRSLAVSGARPRRWDCSASVRVSSSKASIELRATASVALVRLVVHPALIFLALRTLGLAGFELGVPVLIMACPTAIVSYIMAREMDGDARFAAAIIIGTTAVSLVTLLAWLALLGMR